MRTSDQQPEEAGPFVEPTVGTDTVAEPSPLVQQVKRTWKFGQFLSDVLTPTNIIFGVIALVLLLVGALGGWGHVREADRELTAVAPGEQTSLATPWRITITRSWRTDELDGLLTKKKGTRYLIVVGRVANEHNEPVPGVLLRKAMQIDVPGCRTDGLPLGQDACHPHQLLRDDTLSMADLQPGMELPFFAVFEQDSASPAPNQISVQLSSQTWRASSLDGGMDWRDLTPVATVTVPTKEYRP